jgi:hypothetical protein
VPDLPEAIVRAFLVALREVRAEVLSQTGAENLFELVRLVKARKLRPKYRLPSGAHYAKHGIGVRMRGSSGAYIDVDVDSRGRDLFDAWRIRTFADYAGLGPATDAELQATLHAMADAGELTGVDQHFFRVRTADD